MRYNILISDCLLHKQNGHQITIFDTFFEQSLITQDQKVLDTSNLVHKFHS